MNPLDDATATLSDLDSDLGRYDSSEDGKLKKLNAFSRAALYLHVASNCPDERKAVDDGLHQLVLKHGLPEGCIEAKRFK